MSEQKISEQSVDQLCINTIRTLSMDAIQQANSGHPGAPMGLAPVAYTLWNKFIRHNPANPKWPNRDRFILSAGHASMLLYSVLHIMGYEVSLDDIKNFRQIDGICAGHPEIGLAPGVETTTGPLGQGVATSVGFAIAQKWLAEYFNRPGHEIVDYNIYAITSDGCMMEGISGEAASLAGHLALDNLIWIYDSNHITIEGKTDLAFSEDVAARFKSYNWHVQHVDDGNDLTQMEKAIAAAAKETGRPSMIIVDTHIAFGSPNKQDTAGSHGSPLGEDEIKATKKFYGWDPEHKFHVPAEVNGLKDETMEKGRKLEYDWNSKFSAYKKDFPELAAQFEMILKGDLPEGWDTDLPVFPADAKGLATRASGGQSLNAIAARVPWMMGGSADLAPSNNTLIKGAESFQKDKYSGRNLHFGIREHSMGAIANGMALSGLKSYAATFLVFADYMRASIRLSALMELPVVYVFTHDSIGVGEDGPTHQPIEHVASLRAMPNLEVIRPADANEVSVMWKYTMELKDKPAALILTRQNLPTFDRDKYASAEGALKGAYILADSGGKPELILMGSGSEVQLCLAAHEQLAAKGIKSRVVSMPCWSLFERQDVAYKKQVLPSSLRARVAIEAGSTLGWERYVGLDGMIIGMNSFGASAPHSDLLAKFGFTIDNVMNIVKNALDDANSRKRNKPQ
jgi:transketolase